MSIKRFSYLLPSWVRSSIAIKVVIYVGTAIVSLVALQTYININHMTNKLQPIAIKSLNNSLNNSENIFNIIYKQTREDAQIISSHNALANYIDYEVLEDNNGMNEEVVDLEQFLRSLTNFKKQYENVEIITDSHSVIRLQQGEITKSGNLYQQLFSKSNSQLPIIRSEHAYLSQHNEQILFTLNYYFEIENDFVDDQATQIFISITNNITKEVLSLSKTLNVNNILVSLESNNELIYGAHHDKKSPHLWIKESLINEDVNFSLTVYKEKTYAFALISDMQRASFILAIGSILVISISLFITSRFVIASPLKNIIDFINHDVLKQNNLKNRYETNSIDEIGVFSLGLNNMLDQIQFRENALKTSEERLALALWGGSEGMWEFDFNSNEIYLDAGSCVILNLDDKAIKKSAEHFYLMIHQDDRIRVRHYFERFSNSLEELFEAEFRFFTNKTHYVWLQFKGKLNQQNNTAGITGTLRDITEEIKAEQQIHLYATAFNSSNSAIAILDTGFHILAVNKAFNRITGFASEEAAGNLPSFIQHNEDSFDKEDVNQQISEQGYWHGEILGKRKNNDLYVKDIDLNPVYGKDKVLTHYVCVFSDITEKKKSEQELWSMANHDMLTKLPNRGFFRRTLEHAIINSSKTDDLIALLFIDLDKFKLVNDTLGHEAGDELLIKVAKTLTNSIRQNDTVARLGGDEFAIILGGIKKRENAETITKKIIASFEQGINVQGSATGVGASIGISFFPHDADTAESLIHCADTAMYSAKTEGSNLYHFYHANMGDHINRRNQIEHELSIALKENTLSLFYQPQLDFTTGEIVSFEALSRWSHPELGIISPDEFIPIAEDTGLIAELGLNVFNQACKQLKQWQDDGFTNIRMAINISPKQFLLTDIHMVVANKIEEHNLHPSSIELELTESLIVEDPEKIISMLHTLKSIGIRLSIDDFGTGYSSLSYLSKFPLDILKIDKSFVQQTTKDKRGLALTKAIMGIAQSLNLDVIAEGVETQEQLDILKSLGCHYLQGYYFSKAVSAEDAGLLLKQKENLYTKHNT
jgi:diguanylate cyclase (GGDEF)-like protein/PAS domain S-box-containing protein